MSGLTLETCPSNLKSVALTVLELLAFNAQKLRGSRYAPVSINFWGIMSALLLETCTSNLKSVALTVLELLAYNGQKFRGHVTLATPSFRKILRGHIRTVPENMHVKLEVRSFNRWLKISWLTLFRWSITVQLPLLWVPQENLSWYSALNIYRHKVTIAIKYRLIDDSLYQILLILNQDCWSYYLKM